MDVIITNNPAGDVLEAETKIRIACEIVQNRLFDGSSLVDVIGGVSITVGEFSYHYYLQDVINFCVSI